MILPALYDATLVFLYLLLFNLFFVLGLVFFIPPILLSPFPILLFHLFLSIPVLAAAPDKPHPHPPSISPIFYLTLLYTLPFFYTSVIPHISFFILHYIITTINITTCTIFPTISLSFYISPLLYDSCVPR